MPWLEEEKKRTKAFEESLGSWLVRKVKEKGDLAFTWESGNDEAFVTFPDFSEAEETSFQHLEEYVINKLGIPDAGEFSMNGLGSIYMQKNVVRAKFSGVMKALVDFNEETQQEVYSEEIEERGDRALFEIR
jgi:hypothetical protein